MPKKKSFKAGTPARKARSKAAEALKERGVPASAAFAQATAIVKRTKTPAATKRLAKHGLEQGKPRRKKVRT